LVRALRKFALQATNQWDKFIPVVLFAFRTTKNHTTKISPFFLVYGIEPRLPDDLIHALETAVPSYKLISVLFARINNLIALCKERRAALEEIAAMQGKWQREKSKQIPKENKIPLKIGDMVMVFRNQLEKRFGKLDNRWIGPYKIIDSRESGIYKLENSAGLPSTQWFHGDRLKKYHSRDEALLSFK